MKRIKYSFHKYIAGMLALIMLVCNLPVNFTFGSASATSDDTIVYENYLDGWTVGIMWTTLRSEYEWNATTNERRQPKLYVTYRVQEADRTYEPGDLTFTITGIGNAVRGTIVQASDVAADYGAPDPNSNNKWWYEWDPVTDTYTFHNKDTIEQNQSVSGGFEMLWTFNARENTTDYFDTVEATFSIKSDNPDRDGNTIDESIHLPELTYHFTSITDDYQIDITDSQLTPEEWELADPDYVWYDINTRITMQVIRSRGLYESSYFISIDLPEDAEPGKDFVIMDSSGKDISDKLVWDEETGTWGFYLFEELGGDIPSSLGSYKDFEFRLGVSNEYKNNNLIGKVVTVHGHLDRLYLDEGNDWTTDNKQNHYPDQYDYKAQDEVDDEIKLTFEPYEYESDGLIYDLDKDGPYSYANEGRSQPSSYESRLRAQNIYGEGTTLEYTLYGVADRNWTQIASIADAYLAYMPAAALEDGISGIQDDTVWAMVLGDDKLAIVLTDGSIRNLDNSEYDMTYVRVPANIRYDGAKSYTVYYATEQDTAFEDYTKLEGTWDTSSTRTIPLPAGAKAVYIRFDGLMGSYRQHVYIGVNLHLDEEELKNFGSGEDPNHEQFFVNFSYMRAMYDPDGSGEVDDAPDSNYSFSYGSALEDRDNDTYGEKLFRDYAKSWMRTDIVTINTTVDIRPFESVSNQDHYDTTIKATGTISADNEGDLKKFSMYVVLPKGVHVNWNTVSFPFTGTGMFAVGDDMVDFNQYVKVSQGTYDDCDMIIFDFDFSESPLEISANTSFSVEFGAYLRYTDFAILGGRYTTYSYVELHDQGIDKLVGSNLVTDTGDIDNDGDTTERLARATDYEDIDDTARQWSARPFKYVKSLYSDGYVQDTVVQRYHKEEWGDPIDSCYYSYRLDFTSSNVARNIVFYDILENGADIQEGQVEQHYDTEWHGSFISVDISRVEALGGTAIVYYSSDPDIVYTKDADQPWVHPNPTAGSGWNVWTEETDPALVKAIAVAVDMTGMPDGGLYPGTLLYIEVNMLAPTSKDYLNKTAVNQFSVEYVGYDPATEQEYGDTLDSNMTTVTMLETIGKLVLQKVDADNKHSVLTGGMFRVTNEDGVIVFEGSPNAMGRIIVDNVPFGTYYVEEIEAPNGYKKVTGKWKFELKDENTDASIIYDIENERIPGEVILIKNDATYTEYGPLSGAKFELYTSNGTLVYATENGDGSYTYAETGADGAVNEFVTGLEGTLHITGLPWGSYYFVETAAPEGYQEPDSDNKISFTVDVRRYEAPENGEGNGHVIAYVNASNNERLQSIRLVKLDFTHGEPGTPIEGATFSLYRKSSDGGKDTLVAELLQTDQLGRIVVNDLGFGTYYFVETRNAPGYDMPANPNSDEVTLDAGTIGKEISELTITFTNERLKGRVELTKMDDFDQYVEGAIYELFYKAEDKTEFESLGTYTTDEDGIIRVYELEWGEYYFVEVSAPQGWAVSDKHWEFTVNQNNVSNLISIAVEDERALGSIILTKVDKDDETLVLEGAEYELYTSAGVKLTPGVDYTTDKPDNRIITGSDGTVKISDLKQGSYYLQEIAAPEGYSLSGNYIRFSIGLGTSGDVVQNIIARDEKGKAVIIVNKEVNEVYAEFGNPTFIFTVTDACNEPDCGNAGHVYTKTITLSELQLTGSVSFTVDAGHKYIIKEMIAARYKLIGVEGIKNIESVDQNAGTATTVKLTGEADLDRAEVTFTNRIDQYEKLSHTDSATNMVKAHSRLTAITAEFTGPNPITDESVGKTSGKYVKQYDPETENYTFDESVLTVTAYYDDGTSRILSWEELGLDEFTLSEWFIPGGTLDPYHTIHVTYTENGVTCYDEFQVETELHYAPRYTVVLDCNGGSILPDENWANGGSMTAYVDKLEKTNLKVPATVTLPATAAEKHNRDFAGWTLVKYDDGLAPEGVKIYETLEELLISQALVDQYANDTTITLYAYYTSYTVKYAVRIYGIQEDYDGNGNLTGLTFGPAGGADYTTNTNGSNGYVAHLTQGQVTSNNLCIHWMEWEDIIEQSKKDPTKFQACLENGCTHSVELRIKGELAGTSYAGKMEKGDGASVLYDSIAKDYRSLFDNTSTTPNWALAMIRNTLNGVDTGNSTKLDESNALLAMFPEELQENIVTKQITYYTDWNKTDLAVSYDKLWIFAIGEYHEDKYSDPAEGNLYSGQNSNDTGKMYVYRENGSRFYAWSRSYFSGNHLVQCLIGMYTGGASTTSAGIAPGFCLPGPEIYTTKYAVRIYGIEDDVDQYDDAVGLTFGPAGGKSYTNTYVCHLEEDGYTPAKGELCIHNMTWVEIAEQSKKNPHVFDKCMKYGCTHSILLNIEGKLTKTSYSGKMNNGDGAGTLYNSIADDYSRWNYRFDFNGGWRDSKIRNTLNGVETVNSNPVRDDGMIVEALNESNCLLAMFPKEVGDNIVAKKVISATTKSRTSELAYTYDRLWLFSVIEMYNGGANMTGTSYVDPREGKLYTSQTADYLNVVSLPYVLGNTSPSIFYDETGRAQSSWSRTLSGSGENILYFRDCGQPSNTINGSGTKIFWAYAFAPGFCLPGPHTGESTP